MIAVDTNILVYAHRTESVFHARAYACLRDLAEGSRPWGIPAACVHEFLAVVTNARAFSPPSTVNQATAQIDAWLESPQAQVLHSGAQHWVVLARLARAAHLAGGQFHDARIAAICLENSVTQLLSADRDFSRYRGLKVRNPLV